MPDYEKFFEVDEHYTITSEVAQVNQSSVTPLQAYAAGSVIGQSLASPYSFEPSEGGSKVAQPATVTQPLKSANRVARPLTSRAVGWNIPIPTLTFKPFTVNIPNFKLEQVTAKIIYKKINIPSFGFDDSRIRDLEDRFIQLQDQNIIDNKKAFDNGRRRAIIDILQGNLAARLPEEFTGMKDIKKKLGQGKMSWSQLKESVSRLEGSQEIAKYYREQTSTERDKSIELKKNLQTAAGNVVKLSRIQDVKNVINDSLQKRLMVAEKASMIFAQKEKHIRDFYSIRIRDMETAFSIETNKLKDALSSMTSKFNKVVQQKESLAARYTNLKKKLYASGMSAGMTASDLRVPSGETLIAAEEAEEAEIMQRGQKRFRKMSSKARRGF